MDIVWEGSNDWLFLVGGSNNVLDFFQVKDHFSDDDFQRWQDVFARRSSLLGKENISYFHVVIPEKLTVYHSHSNLELPFLNNVPSIRFAKADLPNVVSALAAFEKYSGDHPLYWKTDSHWNLYGALECFKLFCEKVGTVCEIDIPSNDLVFGDLVLDLGGKMTPPKVERVFYHDIAAPARRIYSNVLVKYKETRNKVDEVSLHVGSRVIYYNSQAKDPRKVILFGDSFSEYRPVSLTGLFARTFSEVHFIWNTSLDLEYAIRIKPDIVVSASTERFMKYFPPDSYSVEEFELEFRRKTGHL